MPRFATDFHGIQNARQAEFFRIRNVDELGTDLLLQIFRKTRRKLILDHIHMSAYNDHRTVWSSGLNIDQPLLDFINALFTIRDLPDDNVETSFGQKVLMRSVIFSLSTKIPSTEDNRTRRSSAGLMRIPIAFFKSPIANINSYGGNGNTFARFHVDISIAHPLSPMFRRFPLERSTLLPQNLQQRSFANALNSNHHQFQSGILFGMFQNGAQITNDI